MDFILNYHWLHVEDMWLSHLELLLKYQENESKYDVITTYGLNDSCTLVNVVSLPLGLAGTDSE